MVSFTQFPRDFVCIDKERSYVEETVQNLTDFIIIKLSDPEIMEEESCSFERFKDAIVYMQELQMFFVNAGGSKGPTLATSFERQNK